MFTISMSSLKCLNAVVGILVSTALPTALTGRITMGDGHYIPISTAELTTRCVNMVKKILWTHVTKLISTRPISVKMTLINSFNKSIKWQGIQIKDRSNLKLLRKLQRKPAAPSNEKFSSPNSINQNMNKSAHGVLGFWGFGVFFAIWYVVSF